jgi:hypothetical protein
MLRNYKFGHQNEMLELLADLGPLRCDLQISRGAVPPEITNGRDGGPSCPARDQTLHGASRYY